MLLKAYTQKSEIERDIQVSRTLSREKERRFTLGLFYKWRESTLLETSSYEPNNNPALIHKRYRREGTGSFLLDSKHFLYILLFPALSALSFYRPFSFPLINRIAKVQTQSQLRLELDI
jgi:hypothetical protein